MKKALLVIATATFFFACNSGPMEGDPAIQCYESNIDANNTVLVQNLNSIADSLVHKGWDSTKRLLILPANPDMIPDCVNDHGDKVSTLYMSGIGVSAGGFLEQIGCDTTKCIMVVPFSKQ